MKNKKIAEPHINNVEYQGNLSAYQVNAPSYNGKIYQSVEITSLTSEQMFLVNRALYGLSVYTQKEILTMKPVKRKRILKVHKRTLKMLNLWKQEIILAWSNSFFKKIFPNSSITIELLDKTEIDPDFKCTMSFKELGVNKKQLVSKLFEERILPPNFYQLKS